MRYVVLFVLFVCPISAYADEREAFYGTWGTEKQCSRAPIKQGGTILAQPYEINSYWLKQGQTWCSLKWGPIERRENGLFTAAHAACGEDTVRSYFLGMELVRNELSLRWNFPLKNGPLIRCTGPFYSN